MRTIATLSGEGFNSVIKEDDNGRVFFKSDADIDADGANGQNGGIGAYRIDNKGLELLTNGGMKIVDGRVICKEQWARDIVLLGKDNQPLILKNGIIPSKTWYQHVGINANDPSAYVDAETVPYIVVPNIIITSVSGIVRGCKAMVTYKGKSVLCVVADKGPAKKNGELSIAAAKELGIPHNPRNGGIDIPDVLYEIWPGVPAVGFTLQKA